MIKIESLKAGDVLYDVHSERAGNTTMRQESCWECYVRAVDSEGKWVEISWNGNPARRFAAVPKRDTSERRKSGFALSGPANVGATFAVKRKTRDIAQTANILGPLPHVRRQPRQRRSPAHDHRAT